MESLKEQVTKGQEEKKRLMEVAQKNLAVFKREREQAGKVLEELATVKSLLESERAERAKEPVVDAKA